MSHVLCITALVLSQVELARDAVEVRAESPRTAFLELKLSPFTPLIDQTPGLTEKPYQTTFGGGPMLMVEAQFDFQVFQAFGSLSVGFSGGYAEKFNKAFVENPDGSITRADESTGLRVVPLKVLVTYRFDVLNLRHGVPLVPYVKVGPVLMPWWITKGGEVEVVDGVRGAGYKLGIAAVGGLALALDFLDPRLARDFDTSLGVNHSYLFAEFTYQNMNLFNFEADSRPLDLSSLHWMFGLGLEF